MKRSAQFLEAVAAYDSGDNLLALRLMERCAEAGEAAACFMMALWCSSNEDMPVDQKRSEHWLQRFKDLAERGNLEAQWDLGQSYRFGNVVACDIERANFWLERSAEHGYGESQHHLAWYYETGQYGYPIDKVAAQSWYEKALEQEHPETLYLFAVRQFKDGKPTEDALGLLRKAADRGFKQAEHVLRAHMH